MINIWIFAVWQHFYSPQSLSPLSLLFLCVSHEGVVVVGIQLHPNRGLSESATKQLVEGYQRNGNHRHHTEEDDYGKDPVWIKLLFSFREFFLKRKIEVETMKDIYLFNY